MKTTFAELGVEESLQTALAEQQISEPTEIQTKVIPTIFAGRDVVGQAETGTGKTLAYLLPVLQRINSAKREPQALILTPTHELALQVHRQIELLTKNGLSISSAVVIGQVNIKRQIEKLKEKPQIIVGSSGRILELIQKRKISSQTVRMLVLDEADRLLDDQNVQSVSAVIKTTLRDTQLMLFSATLTPAAMKRAETMLKEPEIFRLTAKVQVPETISHIYFLAEQRDKFELLRKLIRLIEPTRALIFVNKSEEIEKTVEKLRFHDLEAEGLYGGVRKTDRGKMMESFKLGRLRLLVASDLAARGLDIQGVSHIFNLDIPEDPQLYLHRAGRTGRAGEAGVAVSLVTEAEVSSLKKFERMFGINIVSKEMAFGKIADHPPKKAKASVKADPKKNPKASPATGLKTSQKTINSKLSLKASNQVNPKLNSKNDLKGKPKN